MTISVKGIYNTKVYLTSEIGEGERMTTIGELISSRDVRYASLGDVSNKDFYQAVLNVLVRRAIEKMSSKVTDVDSVTLKINCGVIV